MSLERLQTAIRSHKTPIAMGLSPRVERIPEKIRKSFEEMFGPGAMADAESVRYFSTQALDAAAGKLPAVVVHANAYLRHGMMGLDVLCNVVSAARSRELYVILDVNTDEPGTWWYTGADALTVNPYFGGDVCSIPEDKAVFAAVRTGNPSGGDLQALVAGDRQLFIAAEQQMARRGAAIAVGTGFKLDILEARRRCEKAFLLLPDCDGANADPAFDTYGHGAMVVNYDLPYTSAVDEAIREMKGWVTVL